MVETESVREMIKNEILLSWNGINDFEKDHAPTLLSTLNAFQDFLEEYDRFLARSAGVDCELNLCLNSLDEGQFRFILRYCLIPSKQLLLGGGDINHELQGWLVEMHLNLLADFSSLFEEDGLDLLLERAGKRAEYLQLDREPYFSLTLTNRSYSRLERRYRHMIETLSFMKGAITLKIQKI